MKDAIEDIENKIIDDDLTIKYIYLEFFIYLLSQICIISLMLYLHKYIIGYLVLMVIISIVFFMYYLSIHKDNREKEKKLSFFITEKLNYENIIDSITDEKTLILRKNELLKKGKDNG